MKFRSVIAVLGILLLVAGDAQGAWTAVYGLESVKFFKIFDPSARPERLRQVSGSLKLTGGYPSGNVWQTVSYIPRRTAAPKSDYGVFYAVGDRIHFYSLMTFAAYVGSVKQRGERIVIEKMNRDGQAQTEVWYLVR